MYGETPAARAEKEPAGAAQAKPKRRRRTVWIVVWIVLALGTIGGGGYAGWNYLIVPAMMRSTLDEQCDGIEAAVAKHLPTGTSAEAFFDSLGDDGRTWAAFTAFGKSMQEKLDAAQEAEEFERREVDVYGEAPSLLPQPIMELQRFSESPQAYAHEAELSLLPGLLEIIEPGLASLESPEIGDRVVMVPPRQERKKAGELYFEIESTTVLCAVNAMMAATVAHARLGNTVRSGELARFAVRLSFAFHPADTMSMVVAAQARLRTTTALLGMKEAGLLAAILQNVEETLAGVRPLDISSVPAGTIMALFWRRDGAGKVMPFDEQLRAMHDWSAFDSKSPAETIFDMGMFQLLANALDPAQPFGRVFTIHETGASVEDLVCLSGSSYASGILGIVVKGAIELAAQERALLDLLLDVEKPTPKGIEGGDADVTAPSPFFTLWELGTHGYGFVRTSGHVAIGNPPVDDPGLTEETSEQWQWCFAADSPDGPLTEGLPLSSPMPTTVVVPFEFLTNWGAEGVEPTHSILMPFRFGPWRLPGSRTWSNDKDESKRPAWPSGKTLVVALVFGGTDMAPVFSARPAAQPAAKPPAE